MEPHPQVVDCETLKNDESNLSVMGMSFNSEEEAYGFYNEYGRSIGFSIRKHNTTKRKNDGKILCRQLCCSFQGEYHKKRTPTKKRELRRTGCEAMIEVKLEKDDKYHVTKFIEGHNHELVPPSRVHLLRSQRKLQPVQEGLVSNMHASGISPSDIFTYLRTEAGGSQNLNFIRLDSNNFIQRKRTELLKKGDGKSLLEYFNLKQVENKSFFSSIKVNDENQICNCFWTDAKSRIDYNIFGDVVCFDTTYRTNGYDMILAPIVGINNHGQTILFGCALLENEKTETFVCWFNTFLAAMEGKHPKTIFTDQAASIANGIKEVFPNTHHRLCIWHIYQNAVKHLSHVFDTFKNFAKDFRKCIYDAESEEEFLLLWETLLVGYDLVQNVWLQNLYKEREKWAQVYGREHFCAGMTTTQRSESINKFLKKYFTSSLTLREFVDQYDKAMIDRRDKAVEEDNRTRQTKPNMLSTWKAELQASKIYTRKVFAEFQEELVKFIDLDLVLCSDDGEHRTYKVVSYSGARARTITFTSSSLAIMCSCKKFDFTGVLCAHALKLFRSLNVAEIPSQYFLRRWSWDALLGIVFDAQSKPIEIDLDPTFSTRYSELSHITQSIVSKGARSKELCFMTKDALNELLKKLDSFSMSDKNKSVRSRGCINGKDSGDKMIGVKDRRRKKRLSKARKKGVLESNKRDKPESRQDSSIGTGCDNIHGDASLDMHLYNTIHLTHPNLGSDRVVNETSVLRPSSSIPPIYGHPYYQIGNLNIIRAEDSNNYSQRFVELLPQRHLGDAATNQNGPTRRLDF